MSRFNMIAESEVSTVLAEYKPDDQKIISLTHNLELHPHSWVYIF